MRRIANKLQISLSAALFALLACAVPAMAQQGDLDGAIDTYFSGDYAGATQQFSAIATSTSMPKDVRRQALQYLGRSYLAQNETDSARAAITSLLDLEPPAVELNPDTEPPPLIKIYYDVRKEKNQGYGIERPDPGLQTLAIIDFTNSSIDDRERFDPLQRGFPSMMIHNLNGSTDLKVVERERIQWLLDELKLQKDPSLIDQSEAVRAGKLLGAHAVLIGSYTVHDKKMWVSARLVKVETGEILLSEQVTGKAEDFFDLIEDLSLKVAQAINVTVERSDLGARTETKSLDAMISYSEGLQYLETQDYRAAYEKFNEALEYDPSYTRAKLKAESLRPLLASSAMPSDGNNGGSDNGGR